MFERRLQMRINTRLGFAEQAVMNEGFQRNAWQRFWKGLRPVPALASLLLTTASTYAQSGMGSVTGQVSAPTGAVIPGASIELVNVDTSVKVTATSSSDGIYNFTSVIPGTYGLTVKRAGFDVSQIERIPVTTG